MTARRKEIDMRWWRGVTAAGAAALALVLWAGVADAGPLDAPGYTKAFTCSACHGFGGQRGSGTVTPKSWPQRLRLLTSCTGRRFAATPAR